MSAPAARVGDVTATGDAITGPGAPTVLIGGQPAARAGDLVSGGACIGAITEGSTTVLLEGRPAARVGDTVLGNTPTSGSSVTTRVGGPGATTVLIGG